MNQVPRFVSTLALLAVAGFCTFGLLATLESSTSSRLLWQIGYALVGLGCLGRAIGLLRSRREDK